MMDDSGISTAIQQIAEEKDLGDLKPSIHIQCVRSAAKAWEYGKQQFQQTRQRIFLAHIQDVHPASYRVLCPGVVTSSPEKKILNVQKGYRGQQQRGHRDFATCLMKID